jgi:hypothetical protein
LSLTARDALRYLCFALLAMPLGLSGGGCRSKSAPFTSAALPAGTLSAPAAAPTGPPEAALRFEWPLVELAAAYGQPRAQEARLVGSRVHQARLKIQMIDDAAIDARVLPAEGGKSPGVRLAFIGDRVGLRTGRILVATGLDQPKQLILLYSLRVTGNLTLHPSNPYFNLRDPGSRQRVIEVVSARHDFHLRAAQIAEGPFRATVERDRRTGAFAVRVTVDRSKLTNDQRGLAGKLLLISNDPAEPRKEVPLFAMGAVERAGADGPLTGGTRAPP